MATEIMRPTGDITTTWGNPTWSKINDNVLQPSAGDGITAGRVNTESTESVVSFGTPIGVGTVTSITVWWYFNCELDDFAIEARVKTNGIWSSPQITGRANSSTGAYIWESLTWSGLSVSTSSLSLQVGQQPDISFAHGDRLNCDVMYAIITYTPSGDGDTISGRRAKFFSFLDDD